MPKHLKTAHYPLGEVYSTLQNETGMPKAHSGMIDFRLPSIEVSVETKGVEKSINAMSDKPLRKIRTPDQERAEAVQNFNQKQARNKLVQ